MERCEYVRHLHKILLVQLPTQCSCRHVLALDILHRNDSSITTNHSRRIHISTLQYLLQELELLDLLDRPVFLTLRIRSRNPLSCHGSGCFPQKGFENNQTIIIDIYNVRNRRLLLGSMCDYFLECWSLQASSLRMLVFGRDTEYVCRVCILSDSETVVLYFSFGGEVSSRILLSGVG